MSFVYSPQPTAIEKRRPNCNRKKKAQTYDLMEREKLALLERDVVAREQFMKDIREYYMHIFITVY